MNYTGPQAASYPRLGGHLKFFRFSIQLIGEAVVTVTEPMVKSVQYLATIIAQLLIYK